MVWQFDRGYSSSAQSPRGGNTAVFCSRRVGLLLSQGRAPMISGKVTVDGVPEIILSLAGQEWAAIVDTGFNGSLELPLALHGHVNAELTGSVVSLLAAGQTILEDAYVVDFF